MKLAFFTSLSDTLINLWAPAMHQHNTYTQALQKGYIVNGAMKIGMRHRIAINGNNKGLTPVFVDIGRCLTEEIHIGI